MKSAKFCFVFDLQCTQREHGHDCNRKWEQSALKKTGMLKVACGLLRYYPRSLITIY